MAKQSSGGRADPTLVSAGFKLGQSYVPGDYSKIFAKQYEGLTAAHKAKAAASAKILTSLTENMGDFMIAEAEKNIARDVESAELFKDWHLEAEDMANNYTDGSMKENNENFEENAPLNESNIVMTEDRMTQLKEDYEKLNKKLFKNKEDKQDLANLRRKIEDLRPTLVKRKMKITKSVLDWNNGSINKSKSFKSDPLKKMVFGMVYDKKQSKAELEEQGITMSFNDKSEVEFEVNSNLFAKVYEKNTGKKLQNVAADTKIKISEKDLLAGLSYKDIVTEDAANTVQNDIMEEISKYTTNQVTGAKILTIKDFDEVEDRINREYYDVAMASENPNDIYTRKVLIGNTSRVYSDDMLAGNFQTNLDATIINQVGLGGKFSQAELDDGVITQAELAKHKNTKQEIMRMLTNPQTPAEIEFAAQEYADYRTAITKNVFETERKRITEAKKPPVITPGKTMTLWGNSGIPKPSDGDEQAEHALVTNISTGKETVTVRGTTWIYDPITENYTSKETRVRGEDLTIEDTETITREQLIQRASETYGRIPLDWFTTGMNEVITHNTGTGKRTRRKDYIKKGDKWTYKGKEVTSKKIIKILEPSLK